MQYMIIFVAEKFENHIGMLGFDTIRKPVKGEFAKNVRERLSHTKREAFTDKEKEFCVRSEKSLKRYNAVWK